MLKILHTFFTVIILVFTSLGFSVNAFESTDFRYFGVNADINKSSDSSHYIVRTKGQKEHEGFVFTPSNIIGGDKITISIDLKGKGNVFIKLQETDARGTFISETKSAPIVLTDDWLTKQFETAINPKTKQVDIMVFTSSKNKTYFFFKNVTLGKGN